jgi:hypothetical protein
MTDKYDRSVQHILRNERAPPAALAIAESPRVAQVYGLTRTRPVLVNSRVVSVAFDLGDEASIAAAADRCGADYVQRIKCHESREIIASERKTSIAEVVAVCWGFSSGSCSTLARRGHVEYSNHRCSGNWRILWAPGYWQRGGSILTAVEFQNLTKQSRNTIAKTSRDQ